VDALVLRDQSSNPAGGTLDQRLYVQQDANWNVTALVDGKTGSPTLGQVVERYVYDPYGQALVYTPGWALRFGGSAYGWLYLHQGGRYDTATGLYLFRNRDYSPTLGRWMQQDPLGLGAGDTNLYRDVFNNPTRFTDPLGLQPPAGTPPAPLPGFTWSDSQGRYVGPQGATLHWHPDDASHYEHWDYQRPGQPKQILRRDGTPFDNPRGRFKGGYKNPQQRRQEEAQRRQQRRGGRGGRGGRAGCITGEALAGFLGTTVIVAGVAYVYDSYVDKGAEAGFKLATKVGLGEALMLADRDETIGLPGYVFQVQAGGQTINVRIVEPERDKRYITAWYTQPRWSIFYGSYDETVELITVNDNYRVYNVRCPR
jgi:RHS repeat-associated protein